MNRGAETTEFATYETSVSDASSLAFHLNWGQAAVYAILFGLTPTTPASESAGPYYSKAGTDSGSLPLQ